MYGHTILHHACYQQDLEVFRYLVETCGASVHSTDMDGWTVLHQACWFCNLETVRYLVATCGADIVAVNREDKTALDLARSKGKQDIISYLQKRLEIAKVTVPGPAATTGRQDNDPALAQIDSPALPASDVAASSTQAAVQAVPATDLSGTDTSLSYSQTTGQQDVANGFPSEENPIAEVLEDNRIGGSSDPPGTHIWDASYILQSPLSPNGSRVLEADSFESDRSRMKTAIWGKEGTFSTSESYVKSLLTDEVLGHGFFGTVYRGHDQRLGYSFAIKTINTEILSGGNLVDVQRAKKTFQKEQQTLRHFCHPNIASLFAYSFPDDIWGSYYLVYEIAEKGSLDSFWTDDLKRLRLTFRRRVRIALDVLTAMQFLHVGNSSKNISSCFHRDVKSANIVLKQDLTAQLIDCGLAMFVVDDMENLSSGSRKGTPGYICPEYNAGGIPFDCACDIYSFGVVLVELWTGRLQNHKREDSSLFNFGLQYIPGRKGAKRDIHTDLDPMFGYEPSNDVSIKDLLPSYMLRLVRLALQCMDDHDDIPSGKDVLHELVDILHACTSYEDGTTPPVVNTQNEAPDPPEPQLCDWCKSFPKLPNGVACRLCSDAEQQRSEFLQLRGDIQEALALFCAMGIRTDARLEAIGVETHTRLDQLIADTNTTNTTLNTMAPLLGNLDARISSAIPRLFFMVPATRKMALRHPREYLHSRIATKYYLYFVCEHTKSPVVAAAPIKIHMTKRWVEKVAPALVVSLHLLQCGLSAVGVPLNLDGSAFQLTTAAVDDMLTEVASIVDTMGTHSNLLSNLKGQRPVDGSHVPELSGDVYDHMVEKATEQRDWRQHMEPVRTASNPATLWVCKEIADDPTHGYVKARK